MKQHENLIRTARLLCAPPADVYAELKANAERARHERLWQSNGEMENALLGRNEPLIDLALAQYGTDTKVVAQLYQRTATATDPVTVGLRMACLSNQAADTLWNRFPVEIIGEDELKRILASDEEERDIGALLANPRISERLLEELFSRKGQFADLPDDRWIRLLVYAVDNKRIVTCEDDSEGPDMGHYSIQKSIVALLRVAPTTPNFMHVIYNLLSNLDPQQTHGDGDLEAILERWASVETKNYKGETEGGYYTSLSFAQEFQCLVAALYGQSYANNQTKVAGSADASDPALRASYYANTKLSEKQMEAAQEKDGPMFIFASLWNDSLFYDKKLRSFFEEKWMTGAYLGIYRKRLLQLKQRWPNMDIEPASDWIKEEIEEQEPELLAPPASVNYAAGFADIKRRFGTLEKNLLWGFVILAIILYFRH
jgi:hypothetical protein